MENPIKMDDLGVPLYLKTPILPFAKAKRLLEIMAAHATPQFGAYLQRRWESTCQGLSRTAKVTSEKLSGNIF